MMTRPERRSLFQPVVGERLDAGLSADDMVRAYHQRTKHRLDGFAAGPDVLDWDAQPQAFRQWTGAPRSLLPLAARAWPRTWAQAHDVAEPDKVMAPHPLNRAGVALWLEMALGLTAWKRLGPDRWALRANPSSGNLHPTEAYVLAQGVPDLPDGLLHYASENHALAWRAQGRLRHRGEPISGTLLSVGLSSIHWREAWKYGERAFRYCELDTGHVVGALRYAAAALGWRARWDGEVSAERVAHLLGLDRAQDFAGVEAEEPQGLVRVWVRHGVLANMGLAELGWADVCWDDGVQWAGRASRLDPRPRYEWPVIEQVALASRPTGVRPAEVAHDEPPGAPMPPGALSAHSVRADEPMSRLLLERRSAQRFDHRATMSRAALERLLAPLQNAGEVPLDAWSWPPQVQLLVFAHRVEGLAPGAYALPRGAMGAEALVRMLPGGQQPVSGWPGARPLLTVSENPALAGTLRTLSCHQALGSDACVAFSLVAPFGEPGSYRRLLQEAGLLGQALYLRAEAEGLRGTGIGCYFDDAVHEWLGWSDARWQVLYHFTVGHPLTDPRLQSEPAYDEARQAADTSFNVSVLMPGGDTGGHPP